MSTRHAVRGASLGVSGILLRTAGREASSVITKAIACYRIRQICQMLISKD